MDDRTCMWSDMLESEFIGSPCASSLSETESITSYSSSNGVVVSVSFPDYRLITPLPGRIGSIRFQPVKYPRDFSAIWRAKRFGRAKTPIWILRATPRRRRDYPTFDERRDLAPVRRAARRVRDYPIFSIIPPRRDSTR